MRKAFLIILTVLTSTAFGQIFEGKILYTNSYKSKNPNVTDQQWISMMGSTQEYFIKDGDYKSIANGTLVQWQLYVNRENRIYSKMSNSEKAFWNDASIQGDEVIEVEINKNFTEVLGFKCDEIILTCKSGIQKYYFSPKLIVDTRLYINHKFGNWFDYLSKSNALPLKLIIETAQFTMEGTAITINPTKLDKTLFEIPFGIKTEKSPY